MSSAWVINMQGELFVRGNLPPRNLHSQASDCQAADRDSWRDGSWCSISWGYWQGERSSQIWIRVRLLVKWGAKAPCQNLWHIGENAAAASTLMPHCVIKFLPKTEGFKSCIITFTANQISCNAEFLFAFFCRYYGLKPDIKVISPWREWDLTSRSTLIQYAESRGIEVPSSKRGEPPFSMDANLLHISYEGWAEILTKKRIPANFVGSSTVAFIAKWVLL